MRKFSLFPIILLVLLIFLIDLYAYTGVSYLAGHLSSAFARKNIEIGYWGFTGLLIGSILWAALNKKQGYSPKYNRIVSTIFGITLLSVLTKFVFILFQGIGDISHLVLLASNSIFSFASPQLATEHFTLLTKVGLVIATIPFISISYGMLHGRYNFKVLNESLEFENLPESFDGMKIVQISDMHIGSFGKKTKAVKRGIDMVNRLEPDYIFFTGDMVNSHAMETEGWEKTLSQLKAKKGKFAILGNHDYGDYFSWDSDEAKKQNLQNLIGFFKKIGFRLLLNENEKISIGDEAISIIGVENWGKPPFKQYGDLAKATEGTEDIPFKILLSHDPSHWDMEVIQNTDIDLTLSGHTHGMQFGVNLGKFKWSPVKMKYPNWHGLYNEGKQYLYVNRGFGFLGFPGRVGMPPEITQIEFRRKKAVA